MPQAVQTCVLSQKLSRLSNQQGCSTINTKAVSPQAYSPEGMSETFLNQACLPLEPGVCQPEWGIPRESTQCVTSQELPHSPDCLKATSGCVGLSSESVSFGCKWSWTLPALGILKQVKDVDWRYLSSNGRIHSDS